MRASAFVDLDNGLRIDRSRHLVEPLHWKGVIRHSQQAARTLDAVRNDRRFPGFGMPVHVGRFFEVRQDQLDLLPISIEIFLKQGDDLVQKDLSNPAKSRIPMR